MSEISRNENYFIEMRKFHNWIKSGIIKKYSHGKTRLLDLASGKGGDIFKWVKNGIKFVRGYDIDNVSVIESQKRFSKLKRTDLDYKFSQKDLSYELVKLPLKVDIVSCFFALHYFFKDAKSFENIGKNISQNLKSGGYFIMAAFSDENLRKINYTIDSSKIKVLPVEQKSIYGNSISVWIEDTVLDKPTIEYVIKYDTFISVMKKHSLELVEQTDFKDYFSDYGKSMKVIEKKLSFLNTSYVFRKN